MTGFDTEELDAPNTSVAVGDGLGVASLSFTVDESTGVGVNVGLTVGIFVGVGMGVAVGLGVGVGVFVTAAVGVLVGVGVEVGVGSAVSSKVKSSKKADACETEVNATTALRRADLASSGETVDPVVKK